MSCPRGLPGMLNLDTHILLHALAGTLKPAERRLLADDFWSISAIVRWEVGKLHQLGRIVIDLDAPDVLRVLNRVETLPLTWEICRTSCRLDVRGDPADELIAATSVVHNIPLVTRDKALRRSKLVPLARLR
jgi:PIN domain nuclease of toxin-antitoxin system